MLSCLPSTTDKRRLNTCISTQFSFRTPRKCKAFNKNISNTLSLKCTPRQRREEKVGTEPGFMMFVIINYSLFLNFIQKSSVLIKCFINKIQRLFISTVAGDRTQRVNTRRRMSCCSIYIFNCATNVFSGTNISTHRLLLAML